MNPALIKLVPATEDDREFSYQVKKAAEREYIIPIWGWDEDVQRPYHGRDWEERRPDIIEYDGQRIGTLYVREEDDALNIRQFFILPEYQNKGIGSFLLRTAVEQADQRGIISKLALIEGNPVESLYRRFGFRRVDQRDHFHFMERAPQVTASRSECGQNRTELKSERSSPL